MFRLYTTKEYEVSHIDETSYKVRVLPGVKDIKKLLKNLYDWENQQVKVKKTDPEYGQFTKKYKNPTIYLDLKELPVETIADAVIFSIQYEELRDPIMLLNILNLLKPYNDYPKQFFENPNIYTSSSVQHLKLKSIIRKEFNQFRRKFSIYFISLFKSFNKIEYNATDEHIKLPNLYGALFQSIDLGTASHIFQVTENFDTSECIYIEEALKYVSMMAANSSISISLMNNFLEGFLVDTKKGVRKNVNCTRS